MRLKVGNAATYTVEVREIIADDNGEQVWASCDFDQRKILLDATLDEQARRQRLHHEFYHAVCHHYPGSRDEEQEAEFGTSVHEGLDTMIEESGGWGQLRLLYARYFLSIVGTPAAERIAERQDEPTPIDEWVECVRQQEVASPTLAATAVRAQCSVCETIVGDGAIHTSKAAWSPFAGGRVCERQMYCPHCDHVQSWTEGVNALGVPNDAIVAGPTHVGSRGAVEAFLREHPAAVGLVAG